MVRFSPENCPPGLSGSSPLVKRLKTTPIHRRKRKLKYPVDLDLESTSSPEKVERSQLDSEADDEGAPAASFDLDTLDCTICMEPLSPPIFQCCNGHYACCGCSGKMNNTCPTCTEPTGKIRNLALEKIIESLKLTCKFSSFGCAKILTYGSKKGHEQRCLFAPRACPYADCDFCGGITDFRSHFSEIHGAPTFNISYDAWFTAVFSLDDPYVLLLAEDALFLLHNSRQQLGNAVYMTALSPPIQKQYHTYSLEVESWKRRLTYSLEVESWKSRLTMESIAKSFQHVMDELDSTDFLVIPRHAFASEGQLKVEVSINHVPVFCASYDPKSE